MKERDVLKFSLKSAVILPALIILLLSHVVKANTGYPPEVKINTKQAYLALDFLEKINAGEKPYSLVDQLLNSGGTQLIISQLNLARKVSSAQYSQLLNGFIEDKLPDIRPVDKSERARRGVEGLVKNIWPVLKWGLKNTGLLRERLEQLASIDVYFRAHKTAEKFLPEKVDFKPELFIVIGGRAGAAALKGEKIYFDVLMMSFAGARRNEPYLSSDEIVEFFAHEMHHIGLKKILDNNFSGKNLTGNEKRIFSFLSSFVTEGSATFYIDGHHNTEEMQKSKRFGGTMQNLDDIFRLSGDILTSLVNGNIKSNDEFDKAASGMLGNNFHVAGAVMLSAIEKSGGFESVMKVLSNPLLLPAEYNKSVSGNGADDRFRFDPMIVKVVSKLAAR